MNAHKRVDVHILQRPTGIISDDMKQKYKAWWEECLSSCVRLGISPYLVSGQVTTNSFSLREDGFKYGNSEFVSFVNDDDVIINNPFDVCIKELDKNHNLGGVYTNSLTKNEENNSYTQTFNHKKWSRGFHLISRRPVHELVVIRRDVLNAAFDKIKNVLKSIEQKESLFLTQDGEQTIYSAVAGIGDWKFLPNVIGYMWRKHQHGRHHIIHSSCDLPHHRITQLKHMLMNRESM